MNQAGIHATAANENARHRQAQQHDRQHAKRNRQDRSQSDTAVDRMHVFRRLRGARVSRVRILCLGDAGSCERFAVVATRPPLALEQQNKSSHETKPLSSLYMYAKSSYYRNGGKHDRELRRVGRIGRLSRSRVPVFRLCRLHLKLLFVQKNKNNFDQ
jgi:hypothetical protein